jgi:hypothetical protein
MRRAEGQTRLYGATRIIGLNSCINVSSSHHKNTLSSVISNSLGLGIDCL